MSPVQCVELDRTYIVSAPTQKIRYLSDFIYKKSYEDAVYRIFTQAELYNWMTTYGYWSTDEEDRLNGLRDDLDELKCKLYELDLNTKEQNHIRGKIKECKDLIKDLIKKRHALDFITCEHVAESSRVRFMVGASTKNYWSDPLKDWYEPDPIVDILSAKLSEETLSESDVRHIARSFQFKSYYELGRVYLWEETQACIGWYQLYKTLGESECPSEIFPDDDLLDGWLIMNKRKREKSSYEKKAEELANKYPNASEIFVANKYGTGINEEDISKITKMNSQDAQRTKKERMEALHKAGVLNESEMPDTKREIQMAMNRGAMKI